MICDKCGKELSYNKKEVFHATAYVDGELNCHLHLCKECYLKAFGGFVKFRNSNSLKFLVNK